MHGPGDLDPAVTTGLDLPFAAGDEPTHLEQLERLIVIDDRLRHAHDTARSDRRVIQEHRVREVRLIRRAGDGVAVRAGPRVAEQVDDAGLDLRVHEPLPARRECMDLPPRDADDVMEQTRGQPVPTNAPSGLDATVLRQLKRLFARAHDAAGDEMTDRAGDVLRRRWQATLEFIERGGEPCLVVLEQDLEGLGREMLEIALSTLSNGVRSAVGRPVSGRDGAGDDLLDEGGHHCSSGPGRALSGRLGTPLGALSVRVPLGRRTVVRRVKVCQRRSPSAEAHSLMLATPLALRCQGVSRRFGSTLAVDAVELDVPTGSFTSLLGPSGCGKTTLLRIIAGLERLDAGTVEIDGREVDGPSGHVAPEDRSVGMVFQAHALFPHLDIGRNVAFGLRRLERTVRARRVAEVLELVGLTGLERRMPAQLSGGQQQRVALARALAPSPSLLLLDEPFSSLDAALRATVREEVRSILQATGQTALLVTHDQEEALSITDRVGVMFDGRLHQIADPETLYREPATRRVAAFVGDADLVAGTRAASFMVDTPFGRLPTSAPVISEHVTVVVRPENVELRAAADGPATVRHVTFFGHDTLVEVALQDGTTLRSRSGPDARLERGQRVRASVAGTVVTFGHRPAAAAVGAGAPKAATVPSVPAVPGAPGGSS